LLAEFDAIAPAAVVFETFPFGRRALHFELLPLLERMASARPRPLVIASVRDILQRSRHPDRERQTLDIARRAFDAILVHGDRRFMRLDESFPLASELEMPIHYTGFVAASAPQAPQRDDAARDGVVVSSGGGAVGLALLRAALDARSNPETIIVARTDALAVTGLDDAIERARRYAALGADLIFVDAPRDEADLEAIAAAGIGAPLLVNVSEHGKTPDLGVRRFAELGFSVVLYPSSTLFAAAGSTADLARRLREEGTTAGALERMMPFEELNAVLGKDEWDAREDALRAVREGVRS